MLAAQAKLSQVPQPGRSAAGIQSEASFDPQPNLFLLYTGICISRWEDQLDCVGKHGISRLGKLRSVPERKGILSLLL